jgi:tetratricopeptide (TPR) repeat protein
MARDFAKIGQTRVLFTSRETLPEPFARYVVAIGRLARSEAIRLVGRVLGDGNWMPGASDEAQSEEEIEALVDAARCHARALVLLAGEVVASGVRGATGKLHELMRSLETKYPGERERSLLASVELSLQRLPSAVRQRIRPLGVFQGGAYAGAAAVALGMKFEEALTLLRTLASVGLAEELSSAYFRFDPALAPALLADMSAEEASSAQAAWVGAMVELAQFLNRQQTRKASVAYNLARLEMPNLVAALASFAQSSAPEAVIDMATDVEPLIAAIGHSKALSIVMAIRTSAAQQLGTWGHAQFLAESGALDRLLDEGRYQDAVRQARGILQKARATPATAYAHAAYDLAVAHWQLGRVTWLAGGAEEALPFFAEARDRFRTLGETGMETAALTHIGDCMRDLGRLDEAAGAYEEAIQERERSGDLRHVAVGKIQLATARTLQRNYSEALRLYDEARRTFLELGDSAHVAVAWHQIGRALQESREYQRAEKAYQESLKFDIKTGNRSGEATTLSSLGRLYSEMERPEEAALFFRQAVDLSVTLGDSRKEGLRRSNLADQLLRLKRYPEARNELLRAIECKRPFGHVAEPWKTFHILYKLEQTVGDEPAAEKARKLAIQAYLAYRRDGGENQTSYGKLFALLASDPEQAAAKLARLAQEQELPKYLVPLIPKLQAVLAGSRDPALADDPALDYDDAAELLLLIEKLSESATSA